MQRRDLVRSIAKELPVDGDGEECRFVTSEWLTTWANAPPTEAVPPIDNGPLLCQHNRLDPAAWSSAKRVSVVGWHELHSRHGGGPELSLGDLCEACTQQALQEIVAKCASPRFVTDTRFFNVPVFEVRPGACVCARAGRTQTRRGGGSWTR